MAHGHSGAIGSTSGGAGEEDFFSGQGGSALGSILGGLGPLAASNTNPNNVAQASNRLRGGLSSFVGRGGGRREGESIFSNLMKNNLFNETPGAAAFLKANPDMAAAMQARAGRGPGGGLGVFSGVDEFVNENDPGFEEIKGPGFLKQLLGAGLGIGGKLLGG